MIQKKMILHLYKYPFRTLQRAESASIGHTWCSVLFGEIMANRKSYTKKNLLCGQNGEFVVLNPALGKATAML
jgi:hypothetical protein